MANVRKLLTYRETITQDGVGEPCEPVTRVVAMGVFENPFAGAFVQDLKPLFEIGGALGRELTVEALALLPKPAVSYGKAALVGVAGDMEHGAAIIHPMLGAPMRAAIGGGKADTGEAAKS